ncbi:uncharacterized protein LOC126897514 [Daktulosphaira vitifoliae]|uniref:uncharacterized protein LOC126897514 n=1 Tax=Daktulosphaira vitifoliae TaxID=58002 RepID=UPI0021AADE0F|nr:uncharacterized protein LOC126897514 [Daktulosphaira vitifoliae]
MMEYLDSENDDQTGLEKFLSLFSPKGQKENETTMSESTSNEKDIFHKLSNGKSYITLNDINSISKFVKNTKLLGCPNKYIEAFKNIARKKEKSRITFEDFQNLINLENEN